MKAINREEFSKLCELNSQDDYSKAIIDYAIRWADLMEEHIENGEPILRFANKTSHKADTGGITAFMYGAAVSILSKYWIYGEILRRWHNNSYGERGQRANKIGGITNPAIFVVESEA